MKIPDGGRLSGKLLGVSGLLIARPGVSTDEQDLTAQRDALTALGVAPERIYVDHALPRAAVVVEDRYSQVVTLDRSDPRWSWTGSPSCRSAGPRADRVHRDPVARREWTYRYLAAAHTWASTQRALTQRIGDDAGVRATSTAPSAPELATPVAVHQGAARMVIRPTVAE